MNPYANAVMWFAIYGTIACFFVAFCVCFFGMERAPDPPKAEHASPRLNPPTRARRVK